MPSCLPVRAPALRPGFRVARAAGSGVIHTGAGLVTPSPARRPAPTPPSGVEAGDPSGRRSPRDAPRSGCKGPRGPMPVLPRSRRAPSLDYDPRPFREAPTAAPGPRGPEGTRRERWAAHGRRKGMHPYLPVVNLTILCIATVLNRVAAPMIVLVGGAGGPRARAGAVAGHAAGRPARGGHRALRRIRPPA